MSRPIYDEKEADQVIAAIERESDRMSPDDPFEYRFAQTAATLAYAAVQALAKERSTSIEAVLDDLLYRAEDAPPGST